MTLRLLVRDKRFAWGDIVKNDTWWISRGTIYSGCSLYFNMALLDQLISNFIHLFRGISLLLLLTTAFYNQIDSKKCKNRNSTPLDHLTVEEQGECPAWCKVYLTNESSDSVHQNHSSCWSRIDQALVHSHREYNDHDESLSYKIFEPYQLPQLLKLSQSYQPEKPRSLKVLIRLKFLLLVYLMLLLLWEAWALLRRVRRNISLINNTRKLERE